jgi:hypothetical protein
MTPRQITAATLAAVVALSGIGSILVASHTPESVDAVELSSGRQGPPDADLLDPAILRRNDDATDGLWALDDDDDDRSDDGLSTASAASKASAASASSASVSAASRASASSDSADTKAAPTKTAAPKASAPSASASVDSVSSASSDSDD